jgi:hypothetical protein
VFSVPLSDKDFAAPQGEEVAREKVQSVISTFFTLSRGFVVGCGDPAEDLHSKMHGISAVIASPFRERVRTLIAQPPTCRCLRAGSSPRVLDGLQRRSHDRGWTLSTNSPHLYRGGKTGKPHQQNSVFSGLYGFGPRL